MHYPVYRPRRLRESETIRRMVRETRLSVDGFVMPFFVTHGSGVRREIASILQVDHPFLPPKPLPGDGEGLDADLHGRNPKKMCPPGQAASSFFVIPRTREAEPKNLCRKMTRKDSSLRSE